MRFDDARAEGFTGRHTDGQVREMQQWTRIPDFPHSTFAAMTTIRQVPEGSSTVTYVNPLDYGDQADIDWYDKGLPADRLVPVVNGGTV